jgi:hypothetical protein
MHTYYQQEVRVHQALQQRYDMEVVAQANIKVQYAKSIIAFNDLSRSVNNLSA